MGHHPWKRRAPAAPDALARSRGVDRCAINAFNGTTGMAATLEGLVTGYQF